MFGQKERRQRRSNAARQILWNMYEEESNKVQREKTSGPPGLELSWGLGFNLSPRPHHCCPGNRGWRNTCRINGGGSVELSMHVCACVCVSVCVLNRRVSPILSQLVDSASRYRPGRCHGESFFVVGVAGWFCCAHTPPSRLALCVCGCVHEVLSLLLFLLTFCGDTSHLSPAVNQEPKL